MGRQPVTLSSCFEAFLQPEQLSEDDSWYCPTCKEHVQADKKLDLWHLPSVLVVHLKRFCYTKTTREKINTKVDFPLEGLDLGRFLLRPQASDTTLLLQYGKTLSSKLLIWCSISTLPGWRSPVV